MEPFFAHIVNCFVLATVDLSDESGNLKYLADHPTIYATEILKARESFVLIRVESKLLPSSCLFLGKKRYDSIRIFLVISTSSSFENCCFENKFPGFLFSLLSQYIYRCEVSDPFRNIVVLT